MTFSLKKNALSLSGIIFIVMGLIFFLVACATCYTTLKLNQTSVSASGEVIDFRQGFNNHRSSVLYYPIIRFQTPAGKLITFTTNSGSSIPLYKVGQTVAVLYQSDYPASARIDSFAELWMFSIIFGAIGVILLAAGVGLFITRRRNKAQRDWLKQFGQQIMTTNATVSRGTVIVNGQQSYKLNCQWLNPADNTIRIFSSEDIWYDPTPYVQNQSFTVFVDPKNPKKYYVDISHLPKIA